MLQLSPHSIAIQAAAECEVIFARALRHLFVFFLSVGDGLDGEYSEEANHGGAQDAVQDQRADQRQDGVAGQCGHQSSIQSLGKKVQFHANPTALYQHRAGSGMNNDGAWCETRGRRRRFTLIRPFFYPFDPCKYPQPGSK